MALSTSGIAQEPQDFQVQPDQGYHQGEGAVPFHIVRHAGACLPGDHVEIEQQVEQRLAKSLTA